MAWRAALLGLVLLSAAATDAAADLAQEVERARGIIQSDKPDSLARLLRLYRSPPPPQEHFRELIAGDIAGAFADRDHMRMFLEAFTTDLAAPQHAWLVYQVLKEWVRRGHAPWARLAATTLIGQPFHHAAALEALATKDDPANGASAQHALTRLPANPVERAVVVEAAANLLVAHWHPRTDLEHDPTFVLLVSRFDDPDLPDRSRLVLGRMLARALASKTVYVTADAWRGHAERLRARKQLEQEGYYPGSTSVPTFMGIAAAGRDICYVLDVSGSMSTPLRGRPSTRHGGGQSRPRGPVTGRSPRSRNPSAPDPKTDSDAFQGLEDLPWSRIRTRLDLVREALKASLRKLDEDQRFAVVLFEGDARLLPLTRRPCEQRKRTWRACAAS